MCCKSSMGHTLVVLFELRNSKNMWVPYSIYSISMAFELRNSKNTTNVCPIPDLQPVYCF